MNFRVLATAIAVLLLAPLARADPVAVSVDGDASGDLLAVSGTGNAQSGAFAASGTGHASSTCREFGTVPCGTVTALGSTSGSTNVVDAGRARVCHNNGFGHSICAVNGEGDARHVVAVASGNASGGYVAIARDGDARGYLGVSLHGEGFGHYAGVSAFGHATGGLGLSLFGDASSTVAVAPFGHANGRMVGVGGCDLRAELCWN